MNSNYDRVLLLSALVGAFLASTSRAQDAATHDLPPGTTITGELLDPSTYGPSVIESMDVVMERERTWTGPRSFITRPRYRPPQSSSQQAPPAPPPPPVLPPNPPPLLASFTGPLEGDVSTNGIPPDTHGSAGIDHFVSIVNLNLSVYVKSTGVRVVNTGLNAFWNTGAHLSDPRAIWDPNSQRFFLSVTDTDIATARIFLAVSLTSNPTGSWLKTSFIAGQGADAGRFADYPTLGVNSNGVYFGAFMTTGIGGAMTIFALDKSPLIAGSPALGTVTAFRSLPYEKAIQPCVTWGAGVEYLVSDRSATLMRVRRVNAPLTAPTLTEVGNVAVASHNDPPAAPQPGTAVLLDGNDSRHINALFRNGSIWTCQGIDVSNRGAIRWYQVNPATLSVTQTGTVSDATLHYIHGSIAVNSTNDVLLGFSGSSAANSAGAYSCGRLSTDMSGQTSTPALYKTGSPAYAPGGNPTRWGDYSMCTADPVDDTLWTIQEYARPSSFWGTWIAHYGNPCTGLPDCNANGIKDSCDIANGTSLDNNGDGVPDECEAFNGTYFCGTDGSDPAVALCPCLNFGGLNNGCANSIDPNGASLRANGLTSPTDGLQLVCTGLPTTASVVFVKASGVNLGGSLFGDGVRCTTGAQIRFGSQMAQAGQVYYPDFLLGQTPISVIGGTPPGSGLSAFYQVFYRNSAVFCTTATFNISNGFKIVW